MHAGCQPIQKNTTKPLCDLVGISIRSAATQWRHSCKNSVYSMMKWVSKHPADSSKKAVSSQGFAASLPTAPIPSTELAVIQGSHHHCRATTRFPRVVEDGSPLYAPDTSISMCCKSATTTSVTDCPTLTRRRRARTGCQSSGA